MNHTIATILQDVRKTIPTKYELGYFLTHQDRYHYILTQIAKLNLPKKAKVLEIGCYPPHLFHAFEQMGFDVYGISSKHEPIKKRNVVSLNIEQDPFPFKKQFFDLIVFSE
ncbi:hypothetical protein HY468_00355, partial [Candidatus Roizmanbacteria bacterium]|nr:hypothetical protein [Candidatus Roizmanbacteria bacterium]